jgi:hypothetical protein
MTTYITDIQPLARGSGGAKIPASRIGSALKAREFKRAIQRNHSSSQPEMLQLATLMAALARLAAAEDLSTI